MIVKLNSGESNHRLILFQGIFERCMYVAM